MTSVRARFAPSPTGDLHLGNLRVAVFNYLFARHHGGDFVLRVEDTDWARNQEGSLEGILDDLRWAGLEWDEGPDRPGAFGPYLQSERGELHRTAALGLLEEGRAYRCFCAEAEREEPVDDPSRDDSPPGPEVGPGCPGGCRDLSPEEGSQRASEGVPAALRFRVPDAAIEFEDEIRGPITLYGRDVGDFVILRSDGRSTYNFAVVVDDLAMKITHVIRGAGHLSNTPKHALLFDALGAPRPRFAHLPMVLGADRRKLSKREGAAGVGELQSQGFHPDAVVNYLSLLGWSPGDDREILSRKELIQEMTLERVGASDTVFDPDKLRWVSEQHIQRMPLDDLATALKPYLPSWAPTMTREELNLVVAAVRTRIAVFSDIGPALRFVHPDPSLLVAAGGELRREGGAAVRVLEGILDTLSALDAWEAEAISAAIRDWGKELGVRGPTLFHPLRMAFTAESSGPDLAGILAAIGKEEALLRLRMALDV